MNMTKELWLLLLSILGLFVGPILHIISPRKRTWYSILDGFSITSVGGIALLHLFPEAIANGLFMAILMGILGLILPWFTSKIVSIQKNKGEFIILILALSIHAALESSAIGGHNLEGSKESLGLAIILHRLPVGLILFLSASLVGGSILGYISIAFLSLMTLLGFFLGGNFFESIGFPYSLLEAFVAGSLLHVVIGHNIEFKTKPHSETKVHCCSTHAKQNTYSATFGAILGIFLVILVLEQPSFPQTTTESYSFLDTFLTFALESSPALLIAYTIASFLKILINPSKLNWLKKGSTLTQSLKGVAFGLPLPICSCGVLPLYKTLNHQGVPAAAGIAFLIATPELGIDAILLSLPLLGKEFTLYRLLSAFAISVAAAMFLGRMIKKETPNTETVDTRVENKPISKKIKEGLAFGFLELFDHTMPWILFGLFIAALLEPLLGHTLLQDIPHFFQVPIFALLGIPIYVCASGATPIAAILVHKGISAGSALAFLIAGPATNITTFGVLSRLHGRRIAFAFSLIVAFAAILLGWFLDSTTALEIKKLHHSPEDKPNLIHWISFITLFLLLWLSLFRLGPRGFIKQITEPMH